MTTAWQATSTTRPRVLLAEDDEPLREMLVEVLSEHGLDVIACEHGLELVEKLDEVFADGDEPSDAQVDIIISDIRMPGVTGMSILDGLNAYGRPCPVILMTAYADDGTREAVDRLHASGFLTKPFHLDELLALVDRILDLRKRWADYWSRRP